MYCASLLSIINSHLYRVDICIVQLLFVLMSDFCFCFVYSITLALVQRYEDALASRCTLKVLFIIIITSSTTGLGKCVVQLFCPLFVHT